MLGCGMQWSLITASMIALTHCKDFQSKVLTTEQKIYSSQKKVSLRVKTIILKWNLISKPLFLQIHSWQKDALAIEKVLKSLAEQNWAKKSQKKSDSG